MIDKIYSTYALLGVLFIVLGVISNGCGLPRKWERFFLGGALVIFCLIIFTAIWGVWFL